MEYIEPLITCDNILGMFTKEGNAGYLMSGPIYKEVGGKGNPLVTQAINRLLSDKFITKDGDYHRLSGIANEFISKGGYRGLCQRTISENESRAQKELQESQIRQLEIQIKTDQVVDYTTVKRQRRNAYIFAAMSVLIAAASLIVAYLQYLKCK